MNESDIAQRVTRHLDQGVQGLDGVVLERLHEARYAALSRVPVSALRLTPSSSWAGSVLTSGLGRHSGAWLRFAVTTLMLTVGILGFHYWQQDQDADEDNGQLEAKLLSSELPPQAFAQKDFGAWLQETR